MQQKIKSYIKENLKILKWTWFSFFCVFCLIFFVYFNNDAKSGIYPEKEFGSLKELKKELNPYINIYSIKEEKSDINNFSNKVEKVGFGFISTDSNDGGLVIVKVYQDSPSEKAGLQVGDIIVSIDNVKILKDSELGGLIDFKNRVNFMVKRGSQTISLFINRGSFLGEEGLNVGSSEWVPYSDKIPSENIIDQANYGLDKLKNGLVEYHVKGISFFGSLLIAMLWVLTTLPVFILEIIFYKLISKINHKIFIVIINIISILTIMSGMIFLFSKNSFFDEMVRESANMGGGFIDLSWFIYPMFVIFSSLLLIIGYTITLLIYKKNISKKAIN